MNTNRTLTHNAIGTANVRDMAQDANAQIVEVAASHVVMISHPDTVEDLIRTAAGTAAESSD